MISFLIFVSAGFIGGFIHFLQDDQDCVKCSSKEINNLHCRIEVLIKKITISLAAAFILPLFLTIIGNDSISTYTNIVPFSKDFYYLLSFALIAAIAATGFIETVTDNVMKKTEEKTDKNEQDIKDMQAENNLLRQKSNEAFLNAATAKAELYLVEKKYDESVEAIESALSFVSNDNIQKSKLIAFKAYLLIRFPDCKMETVLSLIQEANSLDPNNEVILYNYICYQSIENQLEQAIANVRKLMVLAPHLLVNLENDKQASNLTSDETYIELMKEYGIVK